MLLISNILSDFMVQFLTKTYHHLQKEIKELALTIPNNEKSY